MSEPSKKIKMLSYNDNAALKHIDMHQSIVNRMAANSASCKKWSIALFSIAVFFIVKDKQIGLVWLVVIPIIAFWSLDAYYLSLETLFRLSLNSSVRKLVNGEFTQYDLFTIKSEGRMPDFFLKSITSWSTWPIYIGQQVIALLILQL